MKLFKTAGLIVLMLILALATGCKDDTPTAEPVRTAEEFRAEAAREISAENLDAELDRMEREIEADMVIEE